MGRDSLDLVGLAAWVTPPPGADSCRPGSPVGHPSSDDSEQDDPTTQDQRGGELLHPCSATSSEPGPVTARPAGSHHAPTVRARRSSAIGGPRARDRGRRGGIGRVELQRGRPKARMSGGLDIDELQPPVGTLTSERISRPRGSPTPPPPVRDGADPHDDPRDDRGGDQGEGCRARPRRDEAPPGRPWRPAYPACHGQGDQSDLDESGRGDRAPAQVATTQGHSGRWVGVEVTHGTNLARLWCGHGPDPLIASPPLAGRREQRGRVLPGHRPWSRNRSRCVSRARRSPRRCARRATTSTTRSGHPAHRGASSGPRGGRDDALHGMSTPRGRDLQRRRRDPAPLVATGPPAPGHAPRPTRRLRAGPNRSTTSRPLRYAAEPGRPDLPSVLVAGLRTPLRSAQKPSSAPVEPMPRPPSTPPGPAAARGRPHGHNAADKVI